MRIRKEIAAWLLMALWVIFSVKIAEVLLGESLPGWVEIGGMILCGVLAVASHLITLCATDINCAVPDGICWGLW